MFRQGFSCPALLFSSLVPPTIFRIRGYHPLWPAFPCRFARSSAISRRLLRFRSPLLSESRLMSFPQGTEMVQFPWFASCTLCIQVPIPLRVGFPIQRPPDHSSFASSPKLFAGYHVFLRLSSPRHPPHALVHLTLYFEALAGPSVLLSSSLARSCTSRVFMP